MKKSLNFLFLVKTIKKEGFSLMEIMLVLLIVAVIIAATAPMITTRLGKGMIDDSGLWVRESAGNIYYNEGTPTVIIGAASYTEPKNGDDPVLAPNSPRIVIAGDSIAFAHDNGKYRAGLYVGEDDGTIAIANDLRGISRDSVVVGLGAKDKVGVNNVTIGYNAKNEPPSPAAGSTNGESVVIGANAISKSNRTVVIGSGNGEGTQTHVGEGINNAVVIGYNAKAGGASSGTEKGPVVIGANSYVNRLNNNNNSVVINGHLVGFNDSSSSVAIVGQIGFPSTSSENCVQNGIAILGTLYNLAHNSIAIGHGATINKNASSSIAIGNDATIDENASNSIAIGNNIGIDKSNHVVIGNENNSKSANIIGLSIFKDDNNVFNIDSEQGINLTVISLKIGEKPLKEYIEDIVSGYVKGLGSGIKSDRRLKNVGEKYTAGLDEIKKLELYHYTYKKDEKNIPHVGVMAQDLEKIFPNAVSEGSDGYLRIRMEDMFYALVNAVKQLDKKLDEIVNQFKDFTVDLVNIKNMHEKQQVIIEEQAEIIAKQDKIIQDLTKKVDKLSKKSQ